MVEVAEDAYMPFGDMEMAIRMAVLAAPAVQGEPVAWNDPAVAPDGFVLMPRDLTNEMVRAFCMATVLRWDDAPEDQKIEVAKKLQHAFDAVIAAAPQPAEQQPDKAVACPEGYMMVPAKEFESVLNRADWRTAKNRAELRHMLKSPQALAAPAVQGEPVAWQLRTPEGRVILNKEFPAWADGGDGYKITPLYTAPQPAEQQPCPEDIREGA